MTDGAYETPMERDYPTICSWTRHQGVPTHVLRAELRRALAWVEQSLYLDDPHPHPDDCRGCQSWEADIHLYAPTKEDDRG